MGSQRVGHDWAAELNWVTKELELLFHVHIFCLFLVMCLFISFAHLTELFGFLLVSFKSSFYIMAINPPSDLRHLFSLTLACLLILLFLYSFSPNHFRLFWRAKVLNFDKVQLTEFLMDCVLVSHLGNLWPTPGHKDLFLCLSFIVLRFTFRFSTYFLAPEVSFRKHFH